MTILYGTGFEAGSKGIVPSSDAFSIADIDVSTLNTHTGTFKLVINDFALSDNWIRFGDFSAGETELYASVWTNPSGTIKGFSIQFELTDGTLVGVRKESGVPNQDLHAYINGVNVATGSATLVNNDYRLLELYVKIAASGGKIVVRYDNLVDIDFTGSTKVTSATDIKYIRLGLEIVGNDFWRADDLTVRTDDFPGDIRYISKVPNGDSAVTWTRSAGGTNFSLVNEIPPSDADHVETSTNTNQDLYNLADYSLSNTINHIVQWIRGFSTPAGGEFKMQVKSGTTTSEETTSGLAAAVEYVSRILETDPDTLLAWNTVSFNAALVGQEAVVTTETVRVTQHIIEIGFDQNSSSLLRPLGLDVDLETGSRAWVTVWDSGTLFLKRYPANLESPTSFSFGAATEAQVDARTFYLSPYTPAFFGTASLDDIIYVYGRWNDGAVTHIEKSTDGGVTFVDIGDSATWGADWVGGFLADDASTLFAIINGASPALYRSTNGGTSWSNLSVTPFDVDPQSVSKHADGRILIANRSAGAQMVAYADPPDYPSWTNATGSPAFPTAGGGARSIIWVT